MGATSGAEPSYGSNLARRSKLILGLSAAVLGLFLVARIVVVPHYSKGMAAGNHLLDDAGEPPMAPQRENRVADPERRGGRKRRDETSLATVWAGYDCPPSGRCP